MREFPFPDRIASREELQRDVLYQKIPIQDRIKICDMAWNRGVETARQILREYPGGGMQKIAEQEGLALVFLESDRLNGCIRTFGEFSVQKREMTIYRGSIEKWANANHLSMKAAEELVMAHEFYHYLECTRIGLTSKLYQLPAVKIGNWVLVKHGIRALSEIGAHGFSRTYAEQCCD